jgi:MFS family permease
MLLLASLLLGLVDGIGTPAASDYFLEMGQVRERLDDVTALSVLSLYSFINLAAAPLLAGLMLEDIPGIFFIVPGMIFFLVVISVKSIHLGTGRGTGRMSSLEGVPVAMAKHSIASKLLNELKRTHL